LLQLLAPQTKSMHPTLDMTFDQASVLEHLQMT
jgi:hypothetical protein